MNTLDLHIASLDEIIFEGRNKMYPAGEHALEPGGARIRGVLWPPESYRRRAVRSRGGAHCQIEAAPIIVENELEFKLLPPPAVEKAQPASSMANFSNCRSNA